MAGSFLLQGFSCQVFAKIYVFRRKIEVNNCFGLFSKGNAKKEEESIKRDMKSTQYKKLIHFRFIVLLSIGFLFQHLSFDTLPKNFGFSSSSFEVTQNNYFEKGTTDQHDPQINLFVEAESEDEDDVHDEKEQVNGFIACYQNFNAFHYSDAINTLYLSLASNNQHKVDLPFFVLYHSWKSHLA